MSRRERLAKFLQLTGIANTVRKLGSWSGIVTLNYHRVGDIAGSAIDRNLWSASVDQFDEQVRFLKSNFDVIGPGDLDDSLKRLKGRHVLITFDDGYRDNYKVAFPILESHGVPGVFFVISDFIDNPRMTWWDEAACIVRASCKSQLSLPNWLPKSLAVDQPECGKALRQLLRAFKQFPGQDSNRFLDDLAEAAQANRCDFMAARDDWMTWDMLREMQDAGMAIGGHSHTHPVLAQISPERQQLEIRRCGERLQSELGRPMRYFSYPVGSRGNFNEATQTALREVGVTYAFSHYGGYCRPNHADNLDMRRISVEQDMSASMFHAILNLPGIFAR